jgi:hypothetical protein
LAFSFVESHDILKSDGHISSQIDSAEFLQGSFLSLDISVKMRYEAMLQVRWLDAASRHTAVHVGFVVIKVTLRHVFLRPFGFLLPVIIPPMFMQDS